jgi:hypothetical protein
MPPMTTAVETQPTRIGVNRLLAVMHVVAAVLLFGVLTRVPSTAAEEGTS